MVVVAAVAVFGVDGGGFEESDFVVPHQGFFVDAVQRGKLSDGEEFVLSVHFDGVLLSKK